MTATEAQESVRTIGNELDRVTDEAISRHWDNVDKCATTLNWLAPLGLAGGTATATTVAAKVDSPEPCICPPGAVSRSCRAVGFRSGIMHKDRE